MVVVNLGDYIFTIVEIFLSTKRKGKYTGEHDSWKGRAALILYAEVPSLVLIFRVCCLWPASGSTKFDTQYSQINLGPPFWVRSQICEKRLFLHVFPPVFLSISMEKLGCNWADFQEMSYFEYFSKIY